MPEYKRQGTQLKRAVLLERPLFDSDARMMRRLRIPKAVSLTVSS
jgi:hypothetical protein